jgi:hypothetical protein
MHQVRVCGQERRQSSLVAVDRGLDRRFEQGYRRAGHRHRRHMFRQTLPVREVVGP